MKTVDWEKKSKSKKRQLEKASYVKSSTGTKRRLIEKTLTRKNVEQKTLNVKNVDNAQKK
jgi:hypothetical protein